MAMELTQTAFQQQTAAISANMVTSLNILQLSSEELAQSIRQTVSENPLLELEEQSACPRCGAAMQDGVCPECAATLVREEDHALNDDDDDEPTSYADVSAARQPVDTSDYDPMARVASRVSLADHLLHELQQVLSWEDAAVAQFVVGSLDSCGYLLASDEEIAAACNVSLERAAAVVAALQRLDPPGIGGRDVRECLLIQLEHLESLGEVDAHARRVLTEQFSELGEHRFEVIARHLGITTDAVLATWTFIKRNLTPFPAHSFWEDQRTAGELPAFVAPDVAIRRTASGFHVEVLEAERYLLTRNEAYLRLAKSGQGISVEDRDFLRRCASQAGFLIDCIRLRWNTLRRIGECLAECQAEYLEHGPAHLKPLTRAEVAMMVGLHESTISRATANKFIQLPNRQVVSFDDFFDGSAAAKVAIREIVQDENPRTPLSDQDIAQRLERQGFFLARRTVAKYREALSILPSRLRTGPAHCTPAAGSAYGAA